MPWILHHYYHDKSSSGVMPRILTDDEKSLIEYCRDSIGFLQQVDFVEVAHSKRTPSQPKPVQQVRLEDSVDMLGLNVRARKVMHRRGLKTIAQLIECSAADLMQMNNVGPYTIDSIRTALAPHGLFLKGEKT